MSQENEHADHGRGHPDFGPDEPDCPCRGTPKEAECASTGCGFCENDTKRLDRATKALEQIEAIKNEPVGADWEEIEEARVITRTALKLNGRNGWKN